MSYISDRRCKLQIGGGGGGGMWVADGGLQDAGCWMRVSGCIRRLPINTEALCI